MACCFGNKNQVNWICKNYPISIEDDRGVLNIYQQLHNTDIASQTNTKTYQNWNALHFCKKKKKKE